MLLVQMSPFYLFCIFGTLVKKCKTIHLEVSFKRSDVKIQWHLGVRDQVANKQTTAFHMRSPASLHFSVWAFKCWCKITKSWSDPCFGLLENCGGTSYIKFWWPPYKRTSSSCKNRPLQTKGSHRDVVPWDRFKDGCRHRLAAKESLPLKILTVSENVGWPSHSVAAAGTCVFCSCTLTSICVHRRPQFSFAFSSCRLWAANFVSYPSLLHPRHAV